MFREGFFLLSSERKVVRDFALILFAIIGFAFFGAQATVKAMEWIVPVAQQSVSPAPRMPALTDARTYTVMRSVLDDPTTTGSTPAPARKEADCRR
jgi:hypothetical protein